MITKEEYKSGVLRYTGVTGCVLMTPEWYDTLVKNIEIGKSITRDDVLLTAGFDVSKKNITVNLYRLGFKIDQYAPNGTYKRVSLSLVKMYKHPVEADKFKFNQIIIKAEKLPYLTNKNIKELYGANIRNECINNWMPNLGYVRDERIRAWVKR